ncbi:hypothetical protein B0H13DRAFT_1602066 [Mycena leptocephala]|nr:hypothetical protein B0H13DRAFT_1602066 [Mycena leptocephala]
MTRVDPEDEFSLEWVGLNKSCSNIPSGALALMDEHHYQDDDSPKDNYGRFRRIEWACQVDWFRPEYHWRGWIPLLKPNDHREGAWAMDTTALLLLAGPTHEGLWHLAPSGRSMVRKSVVFWRTLLEDVCESALYDEETSVPPIFDVERIDAQYATEAEVHSMVMDARRAILDCWGLLAWWIAAVPGWMQGLPNEVVQRVLGLQLPGDDKRGYLISIIRDWKQINFPLLIERGVPLYYVWGLFEGRHPRFRRLDPEMIKRWLQGNDRNELEDLWRDDVPFVSSIFEEAARYDRFLQLKIDPYCRARHLLPVMTEISGSIEYWVVDFQHWARRRLSDEETPEALHQLYHHIVLESRSQQITRVVFHRFHPKPGREALMSDGELMEDEPLRPDLSALRERFKGRCAPEYGQVFDPETGIERQKIITKDDPIDTFEDARSYLSYNSSRVGSPRLDSPRRSASPERRGRCSYPIRSATPPPFRRHASRGETLAELEDRRSGWLNTFVDWGRMATFEASLWRKPLDYGWHPDVLECGYLIIDEASEFRLRFQVIANAAIRFPRHVLEVAMERGIQFTIGYKKADRDRFRPKAGDEDMSRQVTKAMVDLRAKGPRLELSPSMASVCRDYRGNLGKIGDSPQARALILRGGSSSWIMRAFVGMGLVHRAMSGPSVQVTIHHAGANDSGDDNCLDLAWDDVSDGDYEAVHGYIQGGTSELDTYLFPTSEMMEEFSDHYFREWNPYCDKTFRQIKAELDGGRGKAPTRAEWRRFFQSSNRGTYKPEFTANQEFIEEGFARIKGALQYASWNKRKISDIARDLPPQFHFDF